MKMKTLYTKFVVVTVCIMIASSVIAFVLSNGYYQYKLKPENDLKNMRIAQSIAEFTDVHADMSLDDYLENLSEIGYQFYIVEVESNFRRCAHNIVFSILLVYQQQLPVF